MIIAGTFLYGMHGNVDFTGITYEEEDGELWVRGVNRYAEPFECPMDEVEDWRVIHP